MVSDAQVEAAWKELVLRYQAPPDMEALRAALEAAERAAWRPFSEVTEGHWLVHLPKPSLMRHIHSATWKPPNYRVVGHQFAFDLEAQPTHFRPLPQPPVT